MNRPPDTSAALRHSLSDIAAQTRRAAEELTTGTVDGLGVTVFAGGRYVFGGCNDFTRAVDGLQYELGDGPCLQAQHGGVLVESRTIGAGELRWTTFTSAAAALGLRSVISAPLSSALVGGSLNVYGSFPDRLVGLEPGTVAALVDAVEEALNVPGLLNRIHTTPAMTRETAPHDSSGSRTAGMSEANLHHLIATLPPIEQAKGVLMGHYGISADQAFKVLTRWSSARQTKLRDVCTALLDHVVAHPRPDLSGGLQALLDTDPPDRA